MIILFNFFINNFYLIMLCLLLSVMIIFSFLIFYIIKNLNLEKNIYEKFKNLNFIIYRFIDNVIYMYKKFKNLDIDDILLYLYILLLYFCLCYLSAIFWILIAKIYLSSV